MGKSSPSPPPAPDPVATANAQGAINKDAAITQAALNRINQVTPYGTMTYSQSAPQQSEAYNNYVKQSQEYDKRKADLQAGGVNTSDWNVNQWEAALGKAPDGSVDKYDTPQWTQTTVLSPEQQQLYDNQTAVQKQFGQTANRQFQQLDQSLSTPLNYDGLPDVGEYSADRQRTEDALYGRINPQLENDRAALEQRLANQGIALGSQAYSAAQGDFGRQANDARYGAIMNAGQEQSRLVDQALARRQQGIQERTSLRTQPLNEISALMSGSQVQNPQFSNVPQVQVNPADYQGAQALKYQGDLAGYNAGVSSQNAASGGLFGLAGTALGAGLKYGLPLAFSDIRLKRDIIKTGTWRGFGKYLFRYLWSDQVYEGVMAQEVALTRPDAVHEVDGFLAVNYGVL